MAIKSPSILLFTLIKFLSLPPCPVHSFLIGAIGRGIKRNAPIVFLFSTSPPPFIHVFGCYSGRMSIRGVRGRRLFIVFIWFFLFVCFIMYFFSFFFCYVLPYLLCTSFFCYLILYLLCTSLFVMSFLICFVLPYLLFFSLLGHEPKIFFFDLKIHTSICIKKHIYTHDIWFSVLTFICEMVCRT